MIFIGSDKYPGDIVGIFIYFFYCLLGNRARGPLDRALD